MSHDPRDPVIVSAVRTPVGRYGGALSVIRPDDLAALAIREAVVRAGIKGSEIDDVIFGAANQAGEDNRNVARMAALLAGLPQSVPGQTVNRLCGSGLQAVIAAGHAIRANEGEVLVAGGVESMSRAPYVVGKAESNFSRNQQIHDTTIGWRFENPALAEYFPLESMGETAENVAEHSSVSRERQDAFAAQSQQRWSSANTAGWFADELISVTIPQRKGDPIVVDHDEHPRPGTTNEILGKLRPAFRAGGTVTAGNAAGINDGAAALVVTSREYAEAHDCRPLLTIRSSAVAGVDPRTMGLGPIPASRLAASRAGVELDDFDLVELNEAFAAQALACVDELGLDYSKVNVSGGSIAIGHPLGSTGARLLATMAFNLRRTGGTLGLVTMCIGVGQGIAMVVERENS